jgi:hypothetical protein
MNGFTISDVDGNAVVTIGFGNLKWKREIEADVEEFTLNVLKTMERTLLRDCIPSEQGPTMDDLWEVANTTEAKALSSLLGKLDGQSLDNGVER